MIFGTGELLDTIVKRAALPISVRYLPSGEHFVAADAVRVTTWIGAHEEIRTLPPQRAKRFYLDLCSQLSQSAALPNPPADAGAQCTGTAATDSPSVAATISDPEQSTLPVSGSSANSAGAPATLAAPAAFSSDGVL